MIRNGNETFDIVQPKRPASPDKDFQEELFKEIGINGGGKAPGTAKTERQEPPQKKPAIRTEPEQSTVREWEEEILDITGRALAPLYDFVGMVAVRLGSNNARDLIRSSEHFVKKGAKTKQEFIKLNKHLGIPFFQLFLRMHQQGMLVKTLVGDCLEIEPVPDLDILRTLIPDEETRFAPAWVWGVLNDASFRVLLHATALGAFERALSEIQEIGGVCKSFTLKELICSTGVRHKFAIFVAYSFLESSGGNAYPGRIWRGSNGSQSTAFNISAGFKTRSLLMKLIYTAKIWFQDVYPRPNSTYIEFKNRIEQLPDDEYKEYMKQIAEQMMKRELVHCE